MSSTQKSAVYDELVDLLADSADAVRLSSFRMSNEKQSRLDALLEKNRLATLTDDESAELDAFEHFEHLVRLLKARMLKKQGR
jgi:hypothetical protein